MKVDILPEHRWLDKFLGDWTMEGEAAMGPDDPPHKSTGTETVRSIGGIWIQCHGHSEMTGGITGEMIMTLGYDPAKKRYVGSWIGSMMTNQWIYEGEVDATGKILTLNTEGPDFSVPGSTKHYRDVMEFKSEDHRILSSHTQGDDGEWTQFMTAHYRRVK